MSRSDVQREALRKTVRELLINRPLTVQLSAPEGDAVDALLEAMLEIVLQHIQDAGGFCDYEWHISGADFSTAFSSASAGACAHCGLSREEHTAHPVLLCADELELVRQLDREFKRAP
jgi:hypothetical protein